MELTPEQEKTWNSCMLLGLIQALYKTQQLTEQQLLSLKQHTTFSKLSLS